MSMQNNLTKQLATYQQARDLRDKINAFKVSDAQGVMSGGVKPGDDEFGASEDAGIVRPGWVDSGHEPEPGYVDPKTDEQYFNLVFMFKDGTGGNQVGLILDRLANSGNSEEVVLRALAAQKADEKAKQG